MHCDGRLDLLFGGLDVSFRGLYVDLALEAGFHNFSRFLPAAALVAQLARRLFCKLND